MDLLKKRLSQGLGDNHDVLAYRFVEDDAGRGNHPTMSKTTDEEFVVDVKTLIWQVVFQASPKEGDHKEAATSCCQEYFFATVLGYQDRVDESQLKTRLVESHHHHGRPMAMEIIEASTNQSNEEDRIDRSHQPLKVVRLELAETNQAEELTGYMSGTIPPWAHTTPMVLLLEESLLSNPAEHGNHHSNDHRPRIFVSTGSGSFCHSLWVPLEDVLPIAKALNAGVCVASFKTFASSDNNKRSELPLQNPKVLLPGSPEGLQDLSTMVRDTCWNQGPEVDAVGDEILKAGDRFPELPAREAKCSQHPMHLAARTGNLESTELLVVKGKQLGHDPVHSSSTGEGDFGDTRRLGPDTCGDLPRQGENSLLIVREECRRYVVAEAEGSGISPVAVTEVGKRQSFTKEDTNVAPSGVKAYNSQVSIKELSKKLRDAAGKKGKAHIVREVIQEAGERFPELVELGTDGNFTKNALHLATWKGDIESIEHLIDAGDKHGLDLVNVVSVGEGNYGKTPIFYAITQDRDDVVKHLLERGANLLILNNKGQSPCSMSVSHLRPSTCELMFDKEHDQILAGGVFQNYRVSHCDGKQYGDLDPRFDIDPINYGEDIVPDLEQFHMTLNAALEGNSNDRQECHKFVSKSFEPRSLRPTTKEMRQCRAERFRANHSASSKRVNGPRLPPSKAVPASAVEEKEASEGDRCIAQMKSDESPLLDLTMEPLDPLPRLSLPDLHLEAMTRNDHAFQPKVVDEAALIAVLAKAVSVTSTLSNEGQHDNETLALRMDARLMELSWGLDCEWKPSRDRGRQYPVATLQLCSRNRAFLIDLQTLCQTSVKDPETPMTDTEKALCQTLTELFMNRRIPILGFGIGQDISKLAVSFPHMPCFQNLHTVVDMDAALHHCFPQSIHNGLRSLQSCVEYLLNKHLDKSEQCSNWQQRPLTASQIEYACLDAAVLPRLLHEALLHFNAHNPSLADGFFVKHTHLLVSWRISILNSQHVNASVSAKSAYNIENGTAKNMLSLWYSRQTWYTEKREPAFPEPIPIDKQRDLEALKQEKEAQKHEAKSRAFLAQQTKPKKKPLKVSNLLAAAKLPKAGQRLGYTKETCIMALLELSVLESLTDETYLGFNHRGGIIQMQNAWLLFVNFGSGMENQKFLNKFSGGGRFMTFTIDPRKDLDGLFYAHVSCDAAGQTLGLRRRLLLFCRPDNSQYLFFGDCRCVGEEARSGNIDLLLTLLDFETLATTTTYKSIVGQSGRST